jgi:hypothetical protein
MFLRRLGWLAYTAAGVYTTQVTGTYMYRTLSRPEGSTLDKISLAVFASTCALCTGPFWPVAVPGLIRIRYYPEDAGPWRRKD